MASKILLPVKNDYWKDVPRDYCVVDARVTGHPTFGWGKLTIPVDISSVVTPRGNEWSEDEKKLVDRISDLAELVYTHSRYTSSLNYPMYPPIFTNDLIRAMLKLPPDFKSDHPISPDTIPPYVIQLLDESNNIKAEYHLEPNLDLNPSVGTQRSKRRETVQLATPVQ